MTMHSRPPIHRPVPSVGRRTPSVAHHTTFHLPPSRRDPSRTVHRRHRSPARVRQLPFPATPSIATPNNIGKNNSIDLSNRAPYTDIRAGHILSGPQRPACIVFLRASNATAAVLRISSAGTVPWRADNATASITTRPRQTAKQASRRTAPPALPPPT